jgi:hypothetical protein
VADCLIHDGRAAEHDDKRNGNNRARPPAEALTYVLCSAPAGASPLAPPAAAGSKQQQQGCSRRAASQHYSTRLPWHHVSKLPPPRAWQFAGGSCQSNCVGPALLQPLVSPGEHQHDAGRSPPRPRHELLESLLLGWRPLHVKLLSCGRHLSATGTLPVSSRTACPHHGRGTPGPGTTPTHLLGGLLVAQPVLVCQPAGENRASPAGGRRMPPKLLRARRHRPGDATHVTHQHCCRASCILGSASPTAVRC